MKILLLAGSLACGGAVLITGSLYYLFPQLVALGCLLAIEIIDRLEKK